MADDCDNYDTWKYGVGTFQDTATYSYFASYAADADLVTSQTETYRKRDVRWLFGTADVCNCNTKYFENDESVCYPSSSIDCTPDKHGGDNCCDSYPDSTSNDLSTSCGSTAQGFSRLQRGLLYMSHLTDLWSDYDYVPNYGIIEGMGHNKTAFFVSEQMQKWAFDVNAYDYLVKTTTRDTEEEEQDEEDASSSVLSSLTSSISTSKDATASSSASDTIGTNFFFFLTTLTFFGIAFHFYDSALRGGMGWGQLNVAAARKMADSDEDEGIPSGGGEDVALLKRKAVSYSHGGIKQAQATVVQPL